MGNHRLVGDQHRDHERVGPLAGTASVSMVCPGGSSTAQVTLEGLRRKLQATGRLAWPLNIAAPG
jgi:hypothetical protein